MHVSERDTGNTVSYYANDIFSTFVNNNNITTTQSISKHVSLSPHNDQSWNFSPQPYHAFSETPTKWYHIQNSPISNTDTLQSIAVRVCDPPNILPVFSPMHRWEVRDQRVFPFHFLLWSCR